MGGKARVILIGGAVGVLAIVILFFMFVPQFLLGDTKDGLSGMTEAHETKEVKPYENTLDMHLGRLIVSYDIPKKERNKCINATKGLANDTVAVYVHGIEEEGVRYTLYVSTNKTTTSGYMEVGEDDDSWKKTVAGRVVFEEKGDRLSVK